MSRWPGPEAEGGSKFMSVDLVDSRQFVHVHVWILGAVTGIFNYIFMTCVLCRCSTGWLWRDVLTRTRSRRYLWFHKPILLSSGYPCLHFILGNLQRTAVWGSIGDLILVFAYIQFCCWHHQEQCSNAHWLKFRWHWNHNFIPADWPQNEQCRLHFGEFLRGYRSSAEAVETRFPFADSSRTVKNFSVCFNDGFTKVLLMTSICCFIYELDSWQKSTAIPT